MHLPVMRHANTNAAAPEPSGHGDVMWYASVFVNPSTTSQWGEGQNTWKKGYQNGGPARLRPLVAFQQQHHAALAHHEAAASLVEGARAGERVVVAVGGERVHGTEAEVTQTADAALRAAHERRVALVVANGAMGHKTPRDAPNALQNAVCGGGAGHIVAHAGPLQSELNGHV